jgi:hypothetical protein
MMGRRSFLLLLTLPPEEKWRFAGALEARDGTWLCCRKCKTFSIEGSRILMMANGDAAQTTRELLHVHLHFELQARLSLGFGEID